ncbi:adventurous gliding motility protein AgmC [Hyalangium minutum]|uniref:adventurous gliding motility protein AgmC n=1 Tax=Hyalangium minutum TaxID=394096 RepID=UPI0005C75FCC|nr:hemagglutinin [Hyalangium minutum]
MRNTLWVAGLLWAGGAGAEPDTFGLGTGRRGLLRVTAQDTVVNRYAQLTASAPAGTQVLTLSDASAFSAGDLVLLHQSTDLTPAPASGDPSQIRLDAANPVGQFEYGRVEAVSPGVLRLTAPLTNGFPARVTQVVSVPEYTDVQVLANGSLRAAPWDGSVGGILALLATGTLSNNGLVSVDGAGFRGGVYLNHADRDGCAGLDEPSASGGSYKGEGLVAGRYGTASGRGNVANGGGGGNCHNSGGGGGGHAGMGGTGARSSDGDRDVGGLGGAAVVYLPYERLVFGGGGGAGEGNNNLGTSGGAGGGLMLLRAGAVVGTGRFSAKGASVPPTSGTGDDGAGGGGAGGAISLRSAAGLACGAADASGGAGGDTVHPAYPIGPGGGGAGGVVFLQGQPLTCPAVVLAGAAGRSSATGDSRGAGPASLDGGSAYGSAQQTVTGVRTLVTPTVSQPVNGAVGVAPRPRFEGAAEQGVQVHLFLDGTPYVQVQASSPDGGFVYTAPMELTPGAHELRASAESLGLYSPLSAVTRFDVAEPAMNPILVSPAQGEQVDPTPLLTGTSPLGVSVRLQVDGAEVAQVPLDQAGRFYYTLTPGQALAPGEHTVTAQALETGGSTGFSSAPTTFTVVMPGALEVGCGCESASGAGLGAVALMLGAWALRSRRQKS